MSNTPRTDAIVKACGLYEDDPIVILARQLEAAPLRIACPACGVRLVYQPPSGSGHYEVKKRKCEPPPFLDKDM